MKKDKLSMDYAGKHVKKNTDSHLSAESHRSFPCFSVTSGPFWLQKIYSWGHGSCMDECPCRHGGGAYLGDRRGEIVLLSHVLAVLALAEQGERKCPLPTSPVQSLVCLAVNWNGSYDTRDALLGEGKCLHQGIAESSLEWTQSQWTVLVTWIVIACTQGHNGSDTGRSVTVFS